MNSKKSSTTSHQNWLQIYLFHVLFLSSCSNLQSNTLCGSWRDSESKVSPNQIGYVFEGSSDGSLPAAARRLRQQRHAILLQNFFDKGGLVVGMHHKAHLAAHGSSLSFLAVD
jgi:hypothetical protein